MKKKTTIIEKWEEHVKDKEIIRRMQEILLEKASIIEESLNYSELEIEKIGDFFFLYLTYKEDTDEFYAEHLLRVWHKDIETNDKIKINVKYIATKEHID